MPHLTLNASRIRRLVACTILSALTLLASLNAEVKAHMHEPPTVEPQQTQNSTQNDRQRINELLQQGKITEALPHLERAVAAAPSDPELNFYLGYVRAAAATNIKDAVARRQSRVRAREELLRAQKLGYESELLSVTLASIPADGSEPSRFSANPKVEEAMSAGEAAFARGDFSEARKAYQRALELDPTQYYAALFIGDSYFKEGHAKKGADQTARFAQAGEWLARAVKINPNFETAHRYWGSVLMDSGKMDEALDKVIEAYVADPYTRLSSGAWCDGHR